MAVPFYFVLPSSIYGSKELNSEPVQINAGPRAELAPLAFRSNSPELGPYLTRLFVKYFRLIVYRIPAG